MKRIDEFHPDRRQDLAETDKGSWFNQPSKSEATIASSLNASAVRKKKIMETKISAHLHKNKQGAFTTRYYRPGYTKR